MKHQFTNVEGSSDGEVCIDNAEYNIKIMSNSIINLRIVYTEYLWTLQIDPHTRVKYIT